MVTSEEVNQEAPTEEVVGVEVAQTTDQMAAVVAVAAVVGVEAEVVEGKRVNHRFFRPRISMLQYVSLICSRRLLPKVGL
jgi:hypothetical protein